MENRNQVPKQSKELSKVGTQNLIQWSSDDRKTLAVVIGRVFDLQKQFGKTTSQLENIIEGFIWALSPYPVEKIISGFGQYIRMKSDMPTPSDIRQLIDPVKEEWKPDAPLYISLKKVMKEEGPFGLDNEEIEYIKKYELHMMKKSQ